LPPHPEYHNKDHYSSENGRLIKRISDETKEPSYYIASHRFLPNKKYELTLHLSQTRKAEIYFGVTSAKSLGDPFPLKSKETISLYLQNY
jgi:hypothetical protein